MDTEKDDFEKLKIQARIGELKSMLQAASSDIGDWKIIKCYEAKLQGEEEPYDIASLMSERQKVRDEINELQTKLEEYE